MLPDGNQNRNPDLMHLFAPAVLLKVTAGALAAIALSVATAVPQAQYLQQHSAPRTGSRTVSGLTIVSGSTSVTSAHSGSASVTRARAAAANLTATIKTGRRPGTSLLPFSWPMIPRPAVRRRFEQPATQWSRGHRGVDLLALVGQPVLSPGNGVVAFSGVVAGRGVITIRHGSGLSTTYEPVDARMPAGTLVARGATIAAISPTAGHCAPLTCLHWGAISGQTYLDPLSLLGLGRPILLPLG